MGASRRRVSPALFRARAIERGWPLIFVPANAIGRARLALVGCAIVEAALLFAIARMPDLGLGFQAFARAFLFACIPWLAAAYVGSRYPVANDRWALAVVLIFAVAFRLPFLAADPTLSDDVYRFVWEGRVQLAGHNPYVLAPASDELSSLRDGLHARINHPEVPSCYPPFLQYLFAAAAFVSPTVTGAKTVFVICDLAAVLLLVVILCRRGSPSAQVVVYAWSPLVVVEIAGNGHPEPAWVALFLLAIILERRRVGAGVAMAFSVMTKLVPLAFLPAMGRRLRGSGIAAFGIACVALVIPFASAGTALFTGIGEYADRWRGNDSLFRLVLWIADSLRERLLRVASIANTISSNPRILSSLSIAKGLCSVALAGLAFWLWRRKTEPVRFALVLYAALLALAPMVHPWYLVPLVAFLAVVPNLAGLLAAVLAVLAYHPLPVWRESQVWREDDFYLFVEWIPVYTVLAATIVLRILARLRRPPENVIASSVEGSA